MRRLQAKTAQSTRDQLSLFRTIQCVDLTPLTRPSKLDRILDCRQCSKSYKIALNSYLCLSSTPQWRRQLQSRSPWLHRVPGQTRDAPCRVVPSIGDFPLHVLARGERGWCRPFTLTCMMAAAQPDLELLRGELIQNTLCPRRHSAGI